MTSPTDREDPTASGVQQPEPDAAPAGAPDRGDDPGTAARTGRPGTTARPRTTARTGRPRPTDAAERDRSAASTLTLLGVIVGVAVVAAAATIMWARATGQAAPDTPSAQQMPATLDDGRRPPAVADPLARATGLPVVMAARLDGADAALDACGLDAGAGTSGFVTPEHMTGLALMDDPPPDAEVQMERPGDQPVHVTCVQRSSGAGWERIALGALPSSGPDAGYPAWLCCDATGNSIRFHVLDVVPGAAWLLQDRGAYAIGYDVTGLDATGVATVDENGMGASEHLWWVDAEGEIVGEGYAGG